MEQYFLRQYIEQYAPGFYKSLNNERVPDFDYLSRIPNDFDPQELSRIEIFGTRLKNLRLNDEIRRNKKNLSANNFTRGFRSFKTQQDIANTVGVSVQTIHKYEAGNISTIPIEKVFELAIILDATPHYLLGYTDNPDDILQIDKDGNIISPRPLTIPMEFFDQILIKAFLDFQELICLEPGNIMYISKLLAAKPSDRQKCFKIIDLLL